MAELTVKSGTVADASFSATGSTVWNAGMTPAKHFYRPRAEAVAAKYAGQFAKLKLFTIDEVFGGWQKAQQTHFADGGVFDEIYKPQ